MIRTDEDNLVIVKSIESVDEINAKFYGRFQFPWPPEVLNCPVDPHFETVMLNQGVGSWDHSVVPRVPNIWVAGCGTNQAVITALKFPAATILASDISTASLETATRTAKQLGITNLEFRNESINNTTYREEFDYVICTGVIHHNADPNAPLEKLVKALRPRGVLELMVYNRYHRITTTAFQKAIRILGGNAGEIDFESEMYIAKAIIKRHKLRNIMAQSLEQYRDCADSELADGLLQPVEYSFTVESLESLCAGSGLEMMASCVNLYDKAANNFSWNMEFNDTELQELYDSLPDLRCWQISNLLMLERSPMLWFYFQRTDSGRPRKDEKQLCDDFLELQFTKCATQKKTYLRAGNGDYVSNGRLFPYPGKHPDEMCRRIVELVEAQPRVQMRDIVSQLTPKASLMLVNKLRLALTTNAFPFLMTTDNTAKESNT